MVRKGFTLVELMIVILIVAILAAVAVPLMMNRVESAKWSEGKAALGTIATNLKAWYAEQGCATSLAPSLTITGARNIGMSTSDLDGTYFSSGAYSLGTPTCNTGVVLATLTCIGGGRANSPTGTVTLTLTSSGQTFTGP